MNLTSFTAPFENIHLPMYMLPRGSEIQDNIFTMLFRIGGTGLLRAF